MIIVAAGEIDPAQVVDARECVIVFATRESRADAAASLLFSDYAVMHPAATLHVDSAAAWAGAIWRIGEGALRLHTSARTSFTAAEARSALLIDAIADDARALFESRSELAIDAAATLIGRRGGDALERAEFARLFAIGEPQRGLAAFLSKRRPRFGK